MSCCPRILLPEDHFNYNSPPALPAAHHSLPPVLQSRLSTYKSLIRITSSPTPGLLTRISDKLHRDPRHPESGAQCDISSSGSWGCLLRWEIVLKDIFGAGNKELGGRRRDSRTSGRCGRCTLRRELSAVDVRFVSQYLLILALRFSDEPEVAGKLMLCMRCAAESRR